MKAQKLKIVCGTDFSAHAAEAADVAAALAQRLNETVVLLHAAESRKMLPGAREQLRKEAGRLRSAGATVKESLLIGSPYELLVESAGAGTVRCIVVSSLGRIAPSRFLVGSTAERTAESSTVPTWVVRDRGALLHWIKGERPLNVCVGHDFSETADAALRWVKELALIGPCNISVAHIWWPPDVHGRLGPAEGGAVDLSATAQQALEMELRHRVSSVIGENEIRLRIEPCWGRIDSALLAVADQERADLIVVGTHQRHGLSRVWLGSVSRGVLHSAPRSVVVVPAVTTEGPTSARIPEIRRVLVATDLSRLGNCGVPYAYAAVPGGGTVCLLHVIEPPELSGPLVPHYTRKRAGESAHRKRLNESALKLRALIPEDAERRCVATQVEVRESHSPARAISAMADHFDADLICLASHGRSGLSRAMMGSVAQKVMARTKRPVLVVRSTVRR